jgi:NCS1 family nucleobase:cation symporter-1
MYGTVMWNPLVMLQYVQLHHYTAACRAGTFFAGLGFLSSQLWVNVTQNTISSGMDLAGLAPKYITQRRGALILAVCGIIIQPWGFLAKANVFITVLSPFGVFIAPITGIVIADLWIVRKQKWNIPDLYLKGGVYWYTWGMNWRALFCFWIAAIPSMRKSLLNAN